MSSATLTTTRVLPRLLLGLPTLAAVAPGRPLLAQEFVWPRNKLSVTHVGVVKSDFTNITAALWTKEGRVLVADGGDSRVLLLDTKGNLVWSSGRKGRGPGEYTFLNSMVRCQDGPFGVYDRTLGRLTLLSGEGKVLGSHAVPIGPNGKLLHCAGGLSAVFEIPGLTGPPEPGHQQWPVLAVHTQAAKLDTVASGYSDSYVASSRALYVTNPLGEFVELAAGGNLVYLCQRGAGRCQVYDPTTGRRDSLQVAIPRRPLSRAVWEAQIREWVKPAAAMKGSGMERELIDLYSKLPKPDHFPRFEAVSADASGRLWARVDSTRWLILSRTGQPVATAVLPSAIRILAIDGEVLLALSANEDGIPQIDLFRLNPATTQ